MDPESRETMITATLEDCSPTELAPHRWWAEGEQRGFQTTLVEEAGVGGPANTGGRSGGAGSGGSLRGAVTGWRSGGAGSRGRLRGEGTGAFRPSLWHHVPLAMLSSPSAAVQGVGAPLRAHTVRGILPQGGHCCRLTHLD